jgi:L-threonylcarbamoyladenylate synthase
VTEIGEALRELRAGRPIVLPTETVYGIGVIPTRPGIDLLFALKGRATSKAIPVLGRDLEALARAVAFDRVAARVAERFWPGPLTMVLPRVANFDVYLGDQGTGIAVRVPDDPVAAVVLGQAGLLAVTSANRSGEAPARTVAEAEAAFGAGVSAYLDGGPRAGRPSTVVSFIGPPRILREGPVAAGDVLSSIDA